MAQPEQLRDGAGRIIGFRREVGGRIEGRDASGLIVGWYVPRTDETRDQTGWIVERGELLAGLRYSRR